jgi:hypothetical protein
MAHRLHDAYPGWPLAASSADLIFASGFEFGDLSSWSVSAVGSGGLTVTHGAAMGPPGSDLETSRGLQAVVPSTDIQSLYVQDNTPNGEAHYRAAFYFDPNGFDPGPPTPSAPVPELILLFAAEDPPPPSQQPRRLVAIALQKDGSQYRLVARVRPDDNVTRDLGPFNIPDGPHMVEFDWKRASTAGGSDGSFALWIDPVHPPGTDVPAPIGAVSNLANGGHSVDFARMGALGLNPGAQGTLYFDAFVSRRENFIDP